eukprot:TRINITY_DN28388_c0_g1_i2.p1 TRINITY_DN28388_c0_g1~~TRINITY_DN28388_c0_g1_i2.p1  ORF type:complete len:485 (+),score=73.49 TRINITY_DN28388_c0_g1_i2:30-1457(+)
MARRVCPGSIDDSSSDVETDTLVRSKVNTAASTCSTKSDSASPSRPALLESQKQHTDDPALALDVVEASTSASKDENASHESSFHEQSPNQASEVPEHRDETLREKKPCHVENTESKERSQIFERLYKDSKDRKSRLHAEVQKAELQKEAQIQAMQAKWTRRGKVSDHVQRFYAEPLEKKKKEQEEEAKRREQRESKTGLAKSNSGIHLRLHEESKVREKAREQLQKEFMHRQAEHSIHKNVSGDMTIFDRLYATQLEGHQGQSSDVESPKGLRRRLARSPDADSAGGSPPCSPGSVTSFASPKSACFSPPRSPANKTTFAPPAARPSSLPCGDRRGRPAAGLRESRTRLSSSSIVARQPGNTRERSTPASLRSPTSPSAGKTDPPPKSPSAIKFDPPKRASICRTPASDNKSSIAETVEAAEAAKATEAAEAAKAAEAAEAAKAVEAAEAAEKEKEFGCSSGVRRRMWKLMKAS